MTAQVPFWTFFPVQSAAESLRFHLANSEPYANADILVFQHGANSPGIATPADFAAVAREFGAEPRLLALHPAKSPHDLGTLGRYGGILKREPDAPIPFEPLSLDEAVLALRSVISERGTSIISDNLGRETGYSEADKANPPSGNQLNPLIRATNWLNNALEPILGAPLMAPHGGYAHTPKSKSYCPVCGRRMDEHTIESVDGHTYYHHPNEQPSNLMEGN
jgi:hypothetical protein